MNKNSQGSSPMAKVGGGDISEREVTRERYTLQTTPQPGAPRSNSARKKQLQHSAPVNKFTARAQRAAPAHQLARLRTCLDQYTSPAARIAHKALSMEDLTPTKRIRKEIGSDEDRLPAAAARGVRPAGGRGRSGGEGEAAARIARFMLVHAWRRRRQEARCLRKTLEFQVSCSERLRLQVSALKSLLDSDNAKVRLAIRELERLKQLLRDKELERQVLEREKIALEGDVSAAEDRASEMSIGWHNCRNELEVVRAAYTLSERELSAERAALSDMTAQRDHAEARLAALETRLTQHEALLSEAEQQVLALRRETDEKRAALERADEMIHAEREAGERLGQECAMLTLCAGAARDETDSLRDLVSSLQHQLAAVDHELRVARRPPTWWPLPFTRAVNELRSLLQHSDSIPEAVVLSLWLLGAARSFFYHPKCISEAVMWSLVPARHGC